MKDLRPMSTRSTESFRPGDLVRVDATRTTHVYAFKEIARHQAILTYAIGRIRYSETIMMIMQVNTDAFAAALVLHPSYGAVWCYVSYLVRVQ